MLHMSHSAGFPLCICESMDGAASWCRRWLRLRAATNDDERDLPDGGDGRRRRLAAVFDIDATLLTRDRRIEQVCQLFDLCHELRITPFLVTARAEKGRSYAEEQLARLGIRGFKRLFMHPDEVRCDIAGAGRVKQHARRKIESHGYVVCFNAGDALHDHFHPGTAELRAALHPSHAYVFLTPEDGVAHLKLPGG